MKKRLLTALLAILTILTFIPSQVLGVSDSADTATQETVGSTTAPSVDTQPSAAPAEAPKSPSFAPFDNASCTCAAPCTAQEVNTACTVCAADIASCTAQPLEMAEAEITLLSIVGKEFPIEFNEPNCWVYFTVLSEDSVSHTGTVALSDQRGTELSGALDLPDVIKYIFDGQEYSFQIVEIKENIFKGNTEITSFNPGAHLQRIGDHAFDGCTGLTGELTLPAALTDIGDYAFKDCAKLSGTLPLPANLTALGVGAFQGCTGFTGDLVIPNGITSISDLAFYGCNGLSALYFPPTLTGIGHRAFYGCWGMGGALIIPHSVTWTGIAAFGGCSGFSSLSLSSNLTEINQEAFANCFGMQGVLTIPYNVTEIKSAAFQDCYGFTSLQLGDCLQTLGDSAFRNCNKLSGTLTLPASVTAIQNSTFYDCKGFTDARFYGNRPTFGLNTFLNFASSPIAPIYRPAGDGGWSQASTVLDGHPIIAQYILKSVTINNPAPKINDVLTAVTVPISAAGNVQWMADGVIIPGETFRTYTTRPEDAGKRISVTITGTGTGQGSTFGSITSLATAEVTSNTTAPVSGAAIDFLTPGPGTVLTASAMPASATAAYTWQADGVDIPGATSAFYTVKNTDTGKRITVKATGTGSYTGFATSPPTAAVSTITGKGYSFNPVTGTLYLSDPLYPAFRSDSNIGLANIKKAVLLMPGATVIEGLFADCNNMTEVENLQTATSLGKDLFQNCTSLKTVSLPDGTKIIGSFFSGCAALETVHNLDRADVVFGEGAFSGCASLKEITLPAGAKLSKGMFSGCTALSTVNSLDRAASFDVEAFSGCIALKTVTLPSGASLPDRMFANCTSLETVNALSSSATTFGSGVFSGCSALKTVDLPAGAVISTEMFLDCKALQSVNNLGNANVAFGERAFYGCSSLAEVTLPNGAQLSMEVFRHCQSLKKVNNLGNAARKIANYAFANCNSLEEIRLPDNAVLGTYAFANCTRLEYIENFSSVRDITTATFFDCAFDFTSRNGYPYFLEDDDEFEKSAQGQVPKVYLSWDGADTATVTAGMPFTLPAVKITTKYGTNYSTMVARQREYQYWLSRAARVPNVTQSGTFDVNKPGVYVITMEIPEQFYANRHKLTFTLTVKAIPLTDVSIHPTTPYIGNVLTAVTVPQDADATYQWSVKNGSSYTPIDGATEKSYTVTENDIGKQFCVRVIGKGKYAGTATSGTTDPAARPAPVTGASIDQMSPFVGDVLTATAVPQSADVTYQWSEKDGNLYTPISGATKKDYTVTEYDVGKQFCVTVSGVGKYSGAATSGWTAAARPLLTAGGNRTLIKGSTPEGTASCTFNGSLNRLASVTVTPKNGMELQLSSPQHYISAHGSTIITLKKTYWEGLPIGEYALTAYYQGGVSASAAFTVKEEQTQPTPSASPQTTPTSGSPTTGDPASPTLFSVLLCAAAAVIALLFLWRLKSKRNPIRIK